MNRPWEAGFPQLLLYSGDTVWRECVGGLIFALRAVRRYLQFEFQTLRALATLKATNVCPSSAEAIAHVIVTAVVVAGFPPQSALYGQGQAVICAEGNSDGGASSFGSVN
jgi:hypothetical protein